MLGAVPIRLLAPWSRIASISSRLPSLLSGGPALRTRSSGRRVRQVATGPEPPSASVSAAGTPQGEHPVPQQHQRTGSSGNAAGSEAPANQWRQQQQQPLHADADPVAASLVALARLKHELDGGPHGLPAPMLDAVVAAAAGGLRCPSAVLAEVLRPLSTLQHEPPQQQAAQPAQALTQDLRGPAKIAGAVGAWAALGLKGAVQDEQLVQLLQVFAGALPHSDVTSRELSLMLWGGAALAGAAQGAGRQGPHRAVLQQALADTGMPERELPAAVWACALLEGPQQQEAGRALELVAAEVLRQLQGSTPGHMAIAVWALGQLYWGINGVRPAARRAMRGSAVAQLLEALPGFVQQHSGSLSVQEARCLAEGVGRLEYHVPGLVPALLAAAEPRLLLPGEGSERERAQLLSSLLHAAALLEPEESVGAFQRLEPAVLQLLGGCGARELGLLAWSHAVVLGEAVGVELARGLLVTGAQLPLREWREHDRVRLGELVALMPQEVRRPLERASHRRATDGAAESHSHVATLMRAAWGAFRGEIWPAAYSKQREAQVVDILSDLVSPLSAIPFSDWAYMYDAANFHRNSNDHDGRSPKISLEGRSENDVDWLKKVGLEFYGAWWWSASEPRRPLGRAVLRRRLLEANGWRVLAAPLEEWAEEAARGNERQYLKGLLRPVLGEWVGSRDERARPQISEVEDHDLICDLCDRDLKISDWPCQLRGQEGCEARWVGGFAFYRGNPDEVPVWNALIEQKNNSRGEA